MATTNMDVDETNALQSRLMIIIEKVKLTFGRSLVDLIDVFNESNYELRIAGESARDLLMHKSINKIELVSSATIPDIKQMFNSKQVSMTVDDKNGAINLVDAFKSTFRIVTVRHNPVQPHCFGTKFKAYWKSNAYSHMFRADSIFLDFDGRIYDYFNGVNDIYNQQVRMNDDPDMLLKEDCMRIFSYFKLFAKISNGKGVHDVGMIEAITANMNRLKFINGELIWRELKIILMQPKRAELLEKFIECGGGTYIGLPDDLNFNGFRKVTQDSYFPDHPLLGISYLCALLKTREELMKLHQRLRLSAYERHLGIFLMKYREDTRNIEDFVYYKEMCLRPHGANRQITREYVLELLKYHNKKTLFQNLLETEPSYYASLYSNISQQEETDKVMNISELPLQQRIKALIKKRQKVK